MTYFNEFGQARLGWNVGVPSGGITPSTLWNSIYSVYNADSVGSSSLKTSLYAAYNGESNANDSFGSNNGTPQGGLTYGTGKIGNAFQFNGTNAIVTLPQNTWNFTSDFSFSLWVNLSQLKSDQGIISNSQQLGGAGGEWRGWLLNALNNKIYFRTMGGGVLSSVISTTSLSTNVWYHVGVTHKTNVTKLYINGVLEATNNTAIDAIYHPNKYPAIGNYYYIYGYDPSTYFNGKVDAISAWQKELTQAEITELYNSGNGAQYITNDFYKPTTNDALNTYNGTAIGGLTYGVGKIGTAFQFNGTNAYVELPDNSFNFTNDFTASAWVYLQTLPSTVCGIVGNFNFAVGGWGMYLSGGNLVAVIRNTAGPYYLGNTTSVFTAGQWTNVVMVFKKNVGFYIYGNGVLAGQLLATVNPNYGISPIPHAKSRIGLLNYSGDWWWMPNNSRIDGVNVWNRALTTTEITELYNSGNGKQYPN